LNCKSQSQTFFFFSALVVASERAGISQWGNRIPATTTHDDGDAPPNDETTHGHPHGLTTLFFGACFSALRLPPSNQRECFLALGSGRRSSKGLRSHGCRAAGYFCEYVETIFTTPSIIPRVGHIHTVPPAAVHHQAYVRDIQSDIWVCFARHTLITRIRGHLQE